MATSKKEPSNNVVSNNSTCNTSKKATLYRYSPENIPDNILKNIFVGRDDLFEQIFKELKTAGKNKTPRFYLIVGSRGIGKSHFLILLYHEIKKELNSLYIPVKFAEEEYSVYRASDFFLRVLEEQGEDVSGILSLSNEDDILYAALERLKEISRKENKIYLIFVENLHEVFRQFDAKEVQKLRSIFQKHDFFSVMASSPIIFPGVADHEEPFYNFFRIQHLRELSLDEIKTLLKKISEIEGNREFLENFKKYEPRIEGIAHLTGGSPRLIIFFYELICRDNFEDIEKVFFKILDEHTPYYQEIFQLLTGQRRLIFNTLISSESPMTPKHIAEKSRLGVPTVITQLRRLEKDGYVLSRPSGRETYYEVRERLFRLWRDMRQPLGRNRISVFLDFLKLWYTSEEQKELFDKKFHLLESGNKEVLKDLCYYVEVLPNKYKTEALMKLTPKMIEFEEWDEADYDIQKLGDIAFQRQDMDLQAKYLVFESLSNYKNDQKSLETLKKTLKFDTKDYSDLLKSGHITISNEMLKAFDKILELNPENEYALSRKGHTLGSLGRYEEALEVLNKVLALNPEDEYALSRKGFVLFFFKRYEEALEVLNKIQALNPEDEYGLSRMGLALILLGSYKEALEVFNKALALNPENEYALSCKGLALDFLEQYEESIEIFVKVKNITSNESLRIECIFSLIEAYISLDKIAEAISEIESIKSKISDQIPQLIEKFIDICWNIIFEELRIGNLGSGKKFIRTIFDLESRLEKETFETLMMNFFKTAVDSGELEVLKTAIDEILELKEDNYPEILKPLVKAVEIIETKDVRKYYKLQVEEREIVADIVQKLSDSGDLLPEEFRRK